MLNAVAFKLRMGVVCVSWGALGITFNLLPDSTGLSSYPDFHVGTPKTTIQGSIAF